MNCEAMNKSTMLNKTEIDFDDTLWEKLAKKYSAFR